MYGPFVGQNFQFYLKLKLVRDYIKSDIDTEPLTDQQIFLLDCCAGNSTIIFTAIVPAH